MLPPLYSEASIYELVGGRAEKHRVAGYTMYKGDKVQNMIVCADQREFTFRAVVGASYSKDRYKVTVSLNNVGQAIMSYCTCASGAKGMCKHVVASMYKLNDYKQGGVKEISEEVACTEKPRQWGIQKTNVSISTFFSDLDFIKYHPEKDEKNVANSAKRRCYSSLPDSKKPLHKSRLQDLGLRLYNVRREWSTIILEDAIRSADEIVIPHGAVPAVNSLEAPSSAPAVSPLVIDKHAPESASHDVSSSAITGTSVGCTEENTEYIWSSDEQVPALLVPVVDPRVSGSAGLQTFERDVRDANAPSLEAHRSGLTGRNLAPTPPVTNVLTSCNSDNLADTEDLESDAFVAKCKNFIAKQVPLSFEVIAMIEYETRGQSSNENWFKHRIGRITASIVGEIVHQRQTTPPDAVVKKIFQYDANKRTPKACLHGQKFEAEARAAYAKMLTGKGYPVIVEESGLIIHKLHPWFAASVDGVVHIQTPEGDRGLVEIKCPYEEPSEGMPASLKELVTARKNKKSNFYLTENLAVNRMHNYYYQVQAQLAVSEMKWCDFFVYYVAKDGAIDSKVSRILFDDSAFNEEIMPRLQSFYLRGVVPELLTRRIQKGHRLYPKSTHYNYRK